MGIWNVVENDFFLRFLRELVVGFWRLGSSSIGLVNVVFFNLFGESCDGCDVIFKLDV